MANETNFTTIAPVKSSSSKVVGNHDGFVDVQSDDSDTTQPIKANSPDSGSTASQTTGSGSNNGVTASQTTGSGSDNGVTASQTTGGGSNSGVTASQVALPQTGVFNQLNTPVIGGECLLLLMVIGVVSRRFFKNKWKAD